MKKLFFAALVATVAVGGALSTTAQVYQGDNSQQYDCSGAITPLCLDVIPSGVLIRPIEGGNFEQPSFYLTDNDYYVD